MCQHPHPSPDILQLGVAILPRSRIRFIQQRLRHSTRLRRCLCANRQLFRTNHLWHHRGSVRSLESFCQFRALSGCLPFRSVDAHWLIRPSDRNRTRYFRLRKRSMGNAGGSQLRVNKPRQRGRYAIRDVVVFCGVPRSYRACRMWRWVRRCMCRLF